MGGISILPSSLASAASGHSGPTRYPQCIEGESACPPEDCGGIPGYEDLLEAISDPDHEEHESILEWVGGKFDSEAFDPKKVHFDNPKTRWEIAFGGETI